MAQSPAGVHFTERTKTDVLNRDFLEARARILDLAASLDRLERAPRIASEPPDGRHAQLSRAIEALLEPGADRAETIQLIFSLEYDPSWRSHFGLD